MNLMIPIDYQFGRLTTAFNGFTRALFGFSRCVRSSLLYSISGLPSLQNYLNYYSCVRRFNQPSHWFVSAIRDRRQTSSQPLRLGLRSSTVAYRNTTQAKKTKWPESVFKWIESASTCWSILLSRPENCSNVKYFLKREFFETELIKIHPDHVIKNTIKNLNEEYKSKLGF